MRSLFIAFFILIPFVSFAQKHDFLWTLGVGPKVNPSSPKTFFFNFHTDPPSILLRNDSVPMGYTSSYSNENGEIIAFTNGLRMYNKNGQLMENGEGLNLTLHQHFDSFYYDYPTLQSAFFLAHPDNPDRLYFISTDVGKHPQPSFFYKYVGRRIVVATIDVKANNGLGKIVKKDEAIIEGNLCTPAAVRHANGRDWWIFCSDADTTRHYRVLLSPEGFSKPEVQWIGSKPNPVGKINSGIGNSFSPKGSWYIDRNDFLGFSIFEFDRCTGQLSNERRLSYSHTPHQIEYKNFPHGYGSGNVFSPDERFLYTTVTWTRYTLDGGSTIESKPFLFQYDLTAPDWKKNVDTLNYNNPLEYFPNKKFNYQVFWGAEMGPDGRIYFVHHRGGYCSVQYPNRKGKASTVYIDQPWFDIDMKAASPACPTTASAPWMAAVAIPWVLTMYPLRISG